MEHEQPVAQEPDPHYMQGFYRGRYNHFCVNGDFFHPGKRILFNPRHFRDFPHYMDYLTDQLKPAFGAVRRICTPNYGRRVRSLEDLRSGGVYVAAGVEKFKPYGYAQIDPNPKKAHARSYDVEPGHNRRYQVSGKYKKIDTHGKIIKCWANGNETTGPRTVLLPAYRNKPITLDAVVEQVSMVLSEECNGPVEKLYLPNGIKVMSLDQILPNAHYVALRRHDTFKRAHYKEVSLPNLRTSPRLERKLPPLPRSNKTSSHSSPEHSYRRERARREEDQVFHARPVKHKRSSEKTRQVDYDQDNGGVFKAKNPNQATRGARQIDDSRQTRTDLPLDRRPAQEVQDEEDQYSSSGNGWREHGDYRYQDEELKGKDKKDKKGKKDEGSGPPDPQRAYRANARRNQSPGNDQARREAEREARARREAEDRERADRARQQREAAQQKKREKEEQKKRGEEEAKRKKEAEKLELEERKRREQEEKQRREEEERRWREEEEEEERRRGGAADASTPNRYEDERSARASSPRMTPISDNRSATHVLHDDQRLAQEEEWAATRIQAGFRGYQARRDLRSQQAGDDFYGAPDSREGPGRTDDQQDWGPGPGGDDDMYQDKHAEEKAATTLQAGFRGYKARQEVRKMRHNQEG